MKKLKVRITFQEEVLGTANSNKDIHDEFIASNAPDAPSREEEIEAIGVEAVIEKGTTIFSRDKTGNPILWDYQIKGFFKDSCASLARCKEESVSKESCKIKAYKKVIDGCIFVEPRQIPINLNGGEIGDCQRPIRGQTAQGERTALAHSETIPAGSQIEFTVICLSDAYLPAVKEWLNYGQWRGIGQWRNSGKGKFKYEILEEVAA